MRLFTLLKRAFTKLGLIADYVVETGADGDWMWQKYSSGIVKLSCLHVYENYSVPCKTAYGNYYRSATLTLTLPFSLVDYEKAAVSAAVYGAGIDFVSGERMNGANEVRYVWCNGSPYVNGIYGTPRVAIQISGYWKTPSLGGGCYLVGLLKGGVSYASIHLAERHYSLYPFGKEFAYRWKHARRWIHSISEWNEGVLGNSLGTKVRRHCDSSCILYLWKSYCTPALQYRNNDEVYFCWKSNVWQAIYCYSLRCSYHSSVYFNYIGNKLCYGRILIPGGDSYAAI